MTQKQSWFKHRAGDDGDKEGDKVDRQVEDGRGKGVGRRGGKDNPVALRDQTKTKKKQQPSTVLFCEYSRGGTLQARLREVVVRLAPLVGFIMRVTERGGTSLGSLLSNKNLWSGDECGRVECRVCCQPGQKREDCIIRNILYESECVKCVTGEDISPSLERE